MALQLDERRRVSCPGGIVWFPDSFGSGSYKIYILVVFKLCALGVCGLQGQCFKLLPTQTDHSFMTCPNRRESQKPSLSPHRSG